MFDQILCLFFGKPRFRKILLTLAVIVLGLCIAEGWDPGVSQGFPTDLTAGEYQKLKVENERLKDALDQTAPKGTYVVVDTSKNRLYLKKGNTTLLDAVCSTGNGKILRDSVKHRQWVFATPTGERRIIKKVQQPVWTKPDWAFIEEGEDIPRSYNERIEEDMLGDYAMHIGNSYMIHGTLYRRLLGRSVTHGCIRLGDADLEKVFKSVSVGTPVFIY